MSIRLPSRLALVVSLVIVGAAYSSPAFRFPAGRFGEHAELKYVGNVPVLQVAGTPEEIGEAVGALALKPGERVLGYTRDLLKLRRVEPMWGFFKGAGKSLYRNFPDDS